MRSRRTAFLLSLALLAGSLLAAQLPSATAGVDVCPCVLLIEVDGLEPKDITREQTPFLWQLAHPEPGGLVGDGRAGWTWQAPRAVMSAGTAANAASLLTGAYPEASGVPADDFIAEGEKVRLESSPQDDARQLGDGDLTVNSLLNIVPGETDGQKESAGFVGNPALSGLIDVEGMLKWSPTPDADGRPNPAYCDVVRRLPGGENADGETREFNPSCSSSDVVTLDKARAMLNEDGDNVAFSYIHLAELGAIKRRNGDISSTGDPSGGSAGVEVPQALAQLDTSLNSFFSQYRNAEASPGTAAKWGDTFVFLAGNHGYETTAQTQRVPPEDGSDANDLEEYMEAASGDGATRRIDLVPQGTLATIYATDTDVNARRQALEAAYARLRNGGPVEQTSLCGDPAQGETEAGGCIKEILWLREEALPENLREQSDKLVVSKVHPDWRLDHLDSQGNPTRASGDMIIVTEPGWATGRVAPALVTEDNEGATGPAPISDITNPYTGSSGGPRNRAVAAIVNGPSGTEGVRQLTPDFYPVTPEADEGELDENPQAAFPTVAAANVDPGDDADDTGHERQPETVDFAPTIAALLQVSVTDEQLHGRFLQEAFQRLLAFPNFDEDPGPPPPEPEPLPEPEPEVVILPPPPVEPPPPPPPAWKFKGLLAHVRAAVGDKKGRAYPDAGSRALLSYLLIKADFGKPLSSVGLTFYRRKPGTSSKRTVVTTLSSFKPFSIKRSRQAKLTLKVPTVYKPTHVGVVVQEARKTRGGKAEGYGPKAGGIYRIKYARHIHQVAPKKAKAKPKPKKQRKKKNRS